MTFAASATFIDEAKWVPASIIDLYKVLTYLSWQTAKNDYEIAVQEKIHNKNNITL